MTATATNPKTSGPTDPLSPEILSCAAANGAPTGIFSASLLSHAMGTYLPATVAVRAVNLVRILLLTWWMSQQQFGLLAMILFTINVMTPLCSLGLNEAIARYVPQHEARGTLRPFTWRSAGLLLAVTVVSVLLMVAFSSTLGVFFYAQVFTDPEVFREFSADAAPLAQLSAAVIGLLIAYFFLLAVFKGLRMFTALAVIELVSSLLFLAGSLVAKLTGHLSAFTMTGMYGISLAIPIACFGLGLARSLGRWRSQHRSMGSMPLRRTLLRFSIWTTLAGVTWQILVIYPAWFLNKVHGNEAVGVFSAVRQVGQFVLLGAVAVTTVVMSTVTNTWESRGREAAQRQLSLAFRGTGLGLLLICTVGALARNIVVRMFSPGYAAGADILPLQFLFFLIGSYLAFLPIHFHLIEKTRHMFWPWAIGVAANVLYAIWLASPRLADVQDLACWKAIAPIASAIFVTGFSDPQGLDGAAWCGVFAIATALILCIVLIRTECTRMDRGTYIVIASAALLTAKTWILGIGVVALLVLALKTTLIFSPDERTRIMGYVVGSLRHIPPFRMLGKRGHGTR
ncbi:MAG TPA: lipopolysaccharide biosynthesis protein [Phycisphaerae bacterium]|nr:lipopolysaccharide biosynthesis protein [Phycisphaerae bacterium]